MTLERAVEILNLHSHRDFDGWKLEDNGRYRQARGDDFYEYLPEFEAIAVAEKYQRESNARAAAELAAVFEGLTFEVTT